MRTWLLRYHLLVLVTAKIFKLQHISVDPPRGTRYVGSMKSKSYKTQ